MGRLSTTSTPAELRVVSPLQLTSLTGPNDRTGPVDRPQARPTERASEVRLIQRTCYVTRRRPDTLTCGGHIALRPSRQLIGRFRVKHAGLASPAAIGYDKKSVSKAVTPVRRQSASRHSRKGTHAGAFGGTRAVARCARPRACNHRFTPGDDVTVARKRYHLASALVICDAGDTTAANSHSRQLPSDPVPQNPAPRPCPLRLQNVEKRSPPTSPTS